MILLHVCVKITDLISLRNILIWILQNFFTIQMTQKNVPELITSSWSFWPNAQSESRNAITSNNSRNH